MNDLVDNNIKGIYIDTITGEEKYVHLGDQVNIIRSNSITAAQRKSEREKNLIHGFNSDKTYVKIYDEAIPVLQKYLTPPEFKLVICLAPHVNFEDCIIRKNTRINGDPLNLKDICSLFGYKYDYGRKMIRNLVNKGILAKVDVGSIYKEYDNNKTEVYLVNPFIYFRGVNVNRTIVSIFDSSGWKNLDEGKFNLIDKGT